MNHYQLLQVDPQASADVINAAWRTLARVYHPDNGSAPDAEKMRLVNHAHDTLKDPVSRRKYDLQIAQEQAARRRLPDFPDFNPFAVPHTNGYGGAYPSPYPPDILRRAATRAGYAGVNVLLDDLIQAFPQFESIVIQFTRGRS